MSIPRFLDRYREIVDDWELFCASLMEPLPLNVWANPLRIQRDALIDLFANAGLSVQPHTWNDLGIEVKDLENPGLGLAFQLGLYQIQEAVSMLPVILSPPREDERVLDLCAAPGNKTVLTAVLMNDSGEVVANDRSSGRLQILKRHVARLGLCNVSITSQNGGRFTVTNNDFDRILVDVPCSCEGTIRKNRNLFYNQHSYSKSLLSTQRFILKRAGELCKPGTKLIYSTCTFAPEENEENIDWFMRKYSGRFKICETGLPAGFQLTPGLKSWQGQKFVADMDKTHRVWPHHNDTGGFYVAVLECINA